MSVSLRALRKLAGVTQEEFARRMAPLRDGHLTRSRVGNLERGESSPSVLTITDYLKCLGLELKMQANDGKESWEIDIETLKGSREKKDG